MKPPLLTQIEETIELARGLYYQLVIVAGPSHSGKTGALRDLQQKHGWPLLNMNLRLSERLLELTTRQRALRVAGIVGDLTQAHATGTVLLDNIEMLFLPDLKQNPIRLLQSLSRNRLIVAAWRGAHTGSSLTYASADHPEYRRFEEPQALIVSTDRTSDLDEKASPQKNRQ